MSKIYYYKLTVDDGGAPCVEKGLLSLAICKPKLRRTAEEGDILIGFAATSLHEDNRLIYVARVSERLENGEYYRSRKYNGRGDCIYKWENERFKPRADARYHGSPGDLMHDLGNPSEYLQAITLISRGFCYFGASGTDSYKKAFPLVAKAVANLGQGHRVNHDPSLLVQLNKLARWSYKLDGACIQGEPTTRPQRGVCHRGGGSCVVAGKSLTR